MLILNKIGDITIFNEFTYQKLRKIFEGKNPTNKTILLMRLFAERNIDVDEMIILKEDEGVVQDTAEELVDNSANAMFLYENLKKLEENELLSTTELLES